VASSNQPRRAAEVLEPVVWAGALLLGIVTLPVVSGTWFVFDNLAALRVPLTVALLVATVAATLRAIRSRDRWHLAGATAIAVLFVVNVALVVPLWTGRPSDPGDGPSLTVAHLNMQEVDGHVDGLAAFLDEQDVDVLVVLEAPPSWAARAREELSGHQVVDGGGGTDSYVVTRIDVGDVRRPLVRPIPLSSLELVAETEAGPVPVLALHTSRPVRAHGARKRDQQLAGAAAWARGVRGPVLVVGDLNATPWTGAFEDLLERGDLRDSARGFGYQPSYPAGWWLLGIPIDQSLYRDGLVPVRRALGPTFGSGHRSLVVEYRLPG
jgi:endonuclease/exonuclease/phosphatase (EEP) superfamily protein YafD